MPETTRRPATEGTRPIRRSRDEPRKKHDDVKKNRLHVPTKLPKYDGKGDVTSWLNKMKNLRRFYDISDAEYIAILGSNLEGEAGDWCSYIDKLPRRPEKFEELIEETFLESSNTRDFDELENLRQKDGEKARALVMRLNTLVKKTKEHFSEKQKMMILNRAFRKETRAAIATWEHKSIDDMLRIAEGIERRDAVKKKDERKGKGKYDIGAITAEESEMKKMMLDLNEKIREMSSTISTMRAEKRPEARPFVRRPRAEIPYGEFKGDCRKCGKYGHRRFECMEGVATAPPQGKE